MSLVPYIAAGDSFSHGQMNAVWAEVDRKMTALFSGKSWIVTGEMGQVPVGQYFYFGAATNPPGIPHPVTLTAYNGGAFDTFADALTVSSFDSVLHIAATAADTSTLDGSLKAHYRVHDGERFYFYNDAGTYVRDNNGRPNRPERRYRLAVAEIVLEGISGLVLPAAWDKWNCFRLHNLTKAPVTVDFAGVHTVTVPPFGCRAVRRTDALTGYNSDLNYFWDFREDDLRAITCVNGDPILETMEANNVANPSLLFDLIEYFGRTKDGPHWIFDPATTAPATVGEGFGDASQATTLLGDLITHTGTVTFADIVAGVVTLTDYSFATWATLKADFEAMGFTVTITGDTLRVQQATVGHTTDAIGTSTNVFKTGTDLRAAVNLNGAVTLEAAAVTAAVTNQTVTASVADSKTFHPFLITYPLGDNPAATTIQAAGQTIAGAVAGGTFGPLAGVATLTALPVDGGSKTFDGVGVSFTPFGPALLWRENFPPKAGRDHQADLGVGNEFVGTFAADGTATIQRAAFFTGHGFPFADTVEAGSARSCKYWMGARAARFYAPASRGFPTGVQGGDVAANGDDFSPAKIRARETTIALLQKYDGSYISSGRFNAFLNADNLHLFTHTAANYNTPRVIPPTATTRTERSVLLTPHFWLPPDDPAAAALQTGVRELYQDCLMPLDAEHYNAFAWMINAVTRCRPLVLADIDFVASLAISDGHTGGVRPVEAYAIYDSATAAQVVVWSYLGVPVKSFSALPSEFRNAGKNVTRRFNINFTAENVVRSTVDSRKWDNDLVLAGTSDGGSTTLAASSPDLTRINAGCAWVSTADVRTVCESLGIHFAQIEFRTPLAFRRVSNVPTGAMTPAPTVGWTRFRELQNPGPDPFGTRRAPEGQVCPMLLTEAARFCVALDEDDIAFTAAAPAAVVFLGTPPPVFPIFRPFNGYAFDPNQPPPVADPYGGYVGGFAEGAYFRETLPAFASMPVADRYRANGAVFDSDPQLDLGYRYETNGVLVHEFSAGFLPACGVLLINREFIGPDYATARTTPLEYAASAAAGLEGIIRPAFCGQTVLANYGAFRTQPVDGTATLNTGATDGAAYVQPTGSGRTFITANVPVSGADPAPASWLAVANLKPIIPL